MSLGAVGRCQTQPCGQASWVSAEFGSSGTGAPGASSVCNVLPQLCCGKSLAAVLFPTGHGKSLRADSLFANLNPCVHSEEGWLSCSPLTQQQSVTSGLLIPPGYEQERKCSAAEKLWLLSFKT